MDESGAKGHEEFARRGSGGRWTWLFVSRNPAAKRDVVTVRDLRTTDGVAAHAEKYGEI